MKKLLILSILVLTSCGENVVPTSPDPSPSPSPIIVQVDPCLSDGLSVVSFIGSTPGFIFPLNQFVTLDSDYQFIDQEAAADCNDLRKVEQWAIIEGHGDLFGNLNSPEAILVAAEPGNFIVRVNAFNSSHDLINGEWKGKAKIEGQAISARADMLSLGYLLLDSR